MSGPIVFISHFSVRTGRLEDYRRLQRETAVLIDGSKPRTLVFVAHLSADAKQVTITHVFPDAEAMDRHFEGAKERSAAAYELMEPAGWEIYGSPSDASLDTIRGAASASGAPFKHTPSFVAGFVRG